MNDFLFESYSGLATAFCCVAKFTLVSEIFVKKTYLVGFKSAWLENASN